LKFYNHESEIEQWLAVLYCNLLPLANPALIDTLSIMMISLIGKSARN